MSYIYNKDKINNGIDDIHKIDIISLNEFFIERSDKLLRKLLFNKFYIIPDKQNFQNNYIKILETYGKEVEMFDYSNLVSMIPKDYYNDNIIQGVINHFGYRYGILNLITPYADGLDKYIEKYIIKYEDYSMLEYILPELNNYYELCETLIKKMPFMIKYVDEHFNRYEELALLSLSVSSKGLFFYLIPYALRSEKLCIAAVNKSAFNIFDVPNTINNYYSLMKIAYEKDKSIIEHHSFPSEYIPLIKKDYPEDFNIQESKSLLKEEYELEGDNEYSDENSLDIFSLSDFLSEKGDNYLKVLIYSRYYQQIKIDRDTFNKNYINIFQNFMDKVEENNNYGDDYIEEDRIGDYIPKEYYTEGIIKNLFNKFTTENSIIYLINQNCENFASIIKNVLLEINAYYMLEYINSNIEGYFDLCKSIIEKHSISIRYIPDSYEKYYDLCKFALSKTINSQLIKYISNEYITEELCYIAVSKNPNAFVYIPSKFKTYELFKLAYSKDNYILINYAFDKEYISQLKNDFPEDKYFIEKYQLKEYISKEVKKLLKEYYLKKR